ncbi:virion structural protein [Pseudomonas phage 201phi2-1]|uniref:Virion structural protein n=1 Tax=Pseudomonas phage 201phi2-1 TaxID=198110 RepID=B3FJW3_BP201|nr:virion structural protein [Pseudomonas phage 201phi2-1]ABY63278.1 virion structural protein [Pseudomonas phage 201phi2-1]
MKRLERLIHKLTYRPSVSNEDAFDTVKQYWDDVSTTFWPEVDEELTEELGVTPTALAELLEVHRHTFEYANIGGNSSIRGYDHGEDWLVVMFSDGSRYLYTLKSTEREQLDYMRRLAMAGKGLNSYITRIVQANYAGRNYKGTITIKPGMEHYNPEGYRRLQLLQSFRNTMMSNTISNEGLIADVKKFFGMSNKSAQKLFIDNTFGWSIIQHIERDIIRPAWLKDQTYIKGDVSGKSVLKYIGKDGKVDIAGAKKQLDAFLATRAKVKSVTDSWRQKTKPAADLLIKNSRKLSPEVYAEARALVDKIPMENHDIKYPTKPIVGNGVKHENPKRVDFVYTVDDRPIPALDEAGALQVASDVQRSIDEFKTNMTGAPDNWPDVMHDMVYTMEPKDYGKVPYGDWYSLIWDILSPNTTGTTHSSGMIANRIYWDAIVGLVRYLDVSIKGDSIISGENYKQRQGKDYMCQTLNRYKQQIELAGPDGLDPVARKIMTVGLETFQPVVQVSIENYESMPTVPSTEDLLSSIKKFFTKGKDTAIYDTVGKGFLQSLQEEVKKYTNLNWVKTHGQADKATVTVDGANLLSEYDTVVPEFIKACQANRVEHHKVAEQAFNNMETVMDMIKRKQLDNSANVEKAITIMKATRQLKAPEVEIPKAKPQPGEVKTLTPEEVVAKAKTLHALFDTLGADLTFVKRWNDNFINTPAWMDWKYVGKSNYSEMYNQVKDPKFADLYEKAMERTYDLRRVGVEFHKLQPYIMAVFQLIEKSVKDS